MPKLAHSTSTSQLIEKVVGRMIAQRTEMAGKKASLESPQSASNMEESSGEQWVTQKLQHKGEDFEKANETSFGRQITRDLLGQGPNSGPLPDKASSDQPEDRSSENDIQDNPLFDVFESVGEPTQEITDPGTQGEPVSDKLQLKKDAAAILSRMDDVNKQGQQIIDYMMKLTVDRKEASAEQRTYTQDELITEAAKLASADSRTEVKTAMVTLVDDAIYAAEATALVLKNEQSHSQQKSASEEELPETQIAADPVPAPSAVDVGGTQAMDAMTEPAPAAEMGGEPPISEEEAQALMGESLQEIGIEPPAAPDGEIVQEGEGIDISPEELALFEQAMQQAGVTPEEVAEAIAELEAEQEAGINPAEGAIADEEAAKTGHYKFASFINRPAAKTAEQEQRAAMIRGAVRDFVYGPNTRNFN
jgi:hypothetical protein